MANKENSIKTPILRDLILSILMQATMVEAARISFTSHTPSVIQYKAIKNNPTIIDKTSNNLMRPCRG